MSQKPTDFLIIEVYTEIIKKITFLRRAIATEVIMRYTAARKYPITQRKKASRPEDSNRIIDVSIGVAAGLLGIVFLGGVFGGYMIRGMHK